MCRFINIELKSDSESDLGSDLEKMEAKNYSELEADSENDWILLFIYWCLFVIILLWYVSVVCIDGASRSLFHKIFRKSMLLLQKLWISSINSVRNLQILNFSKKNKKK